MDNMSDSKEYYSEKRFPYNIKDYIIEESSYMKESFKSHRRKVRLKGGEDDVEGDKVYPKSPAERYVDCLTMSEDKFLLMRLIAMARLRNKFDLEDGREDKFKLMARIVLMLKPRAKYGLQKPDQIFFCDKDPDNGRFTFVPDYRLQQMEFATKFILKDNYVDAIRDEAVIMHVSGTERLEKIQEAVQRLQKVISRIKVVSK